MDRFGVYENEQPCKHPHSGQIRLAKIKGLVVDTTGAAASGNKYKEGFICSHRNRMLTVDLKKKKVHKCSPTDGFQFLKELERLEM